MASFKKTALIITILTFLSKLIGFGREILLANFFGTSYIIDSYQMASSIPTIIFGGLVGMIAFSYVPIYSEINEIEGREKALEYTNKSVNITFVLSIFLSIIGIVFSKQIVSVFASGFEGDVYDLTVRFLRIIMLILISYSFNRLINSFLHCNEKFISAKLADFVVNIVNITFIIIAGLFDYYYLIFGVLLADISRAFTGYFISRKNGYKFKIDLDFKDDRIIKTLKVSLPIFIGSMAYQINSFVDKSIASRLPEGSISSLTYSNRVSMLIYSLLTIAVLTMLYPKLSKLSAEGNIEAFKKLLINSINFILIIMIPIIIGAIILSKPIIVLLYERGNFDSQSTLLTTSAFVFYSIGLIGIALKDLLTRSFFSIKNTKTPMYIGFFSVALNITLNLILVNYMGHNGLALATSITALVTTIPLILALKTKIGSLGLLNSVRVLLKTSVSGLVMGLILFKVYPIIYSVIGQGFIKEAIGLIITTGIGAFIYFLGLYILKLKEMDKFFSLLKNRE